MYVLDTHRGNRSDDGVPDRLTDGAAETLFVGEDERRRSRFRSTTEAGTDVGVVVGRELQAGDLLEGDGLTVVVELEPVEALVVDLADVDSVPGAVELGHTAGNRHWDVALRDEEVLFPVTDSGRRMRSAIASSLPDGATVATETVSPTTFDDGPLRAHGGAGGHSHDHQHDHAHADGERGHGHGHRDQSDGHGDGDGS